MRLSVWTTRYHTSLVQDKDTDLEAIIQRRRTPAPTAAVVTPASKRSGPFYDKEHLNVLQSVFTFLDGGAWRDGGRCTQLGRSPRAL